MFVQPLSAKLLKPVLQAAAEPAAKAAQVAVTEGAEKMFANAVGQAAPKLAEDTLERAAMMVNQSAAPAWGIAKSILAIGAGVLLMLFLGPRALKIAAKGVQMLASKLFHPGFLTGLAEKAFLLYGVAETVLPRAKNILGKLNLAPALESSIKVGERIGQNIPNIIEPGLNILKEPSRLSGVLKRLKLPPELIEVAEKLQPAVSKILKPTTNTVQQAAR